MVFNVGISIILSKSDSSKEFLAKAGGDIALGI